MLYGNLIFIKKTGGDGSKFPVTEKDIKIGRSEDCLIRIYNPQVAPEHCQLIIKDSGQATLRDLSDETILNGKPLAQGDTVLSHGDVLKIGARSARWEYLPTSVNYKQDLTPAEKTGRLVAVVMPQQRSSGDQATPGASTSQASVMKNTPLGRRTQNERPSEGSWAVKIMKSNGFELVSRNKVDLLKLLSGRHSLKSTKLLVNGAKTKQRKSTSGMIGTKTPVGKGRGKYRRSTLPSWKVNIVSPPETPTELRKSLPKSARKSTRSSKNAAKTPLKNVGSDEELLSTSKSEIKIRQRTPAESKSEEVVKSNSGVLKSSLQTIVESPSKKSQTLVTSRRSFSNSPSPKKRLIKSPSKAVFSTPRQKRSKLLKPIHSESKIKLNTFSAGKKTMRLALNPLDSPLSSGRKSQGRGRNSNALSSGESVTETVSQSSVKTNLNSESSPLKRTPRKSEEIMPVKKTPGKVVKSSKKSPINKFGQSPAEIQKKTPRKSVNVKTPGSLTRGKRKSTEDAQFSPSDIALASAAKRRKYTPRKSVSAGNTPRNKTPAVLVKSVEELSLSGAVTPALPSRVDAKSSEKKTPQRGRKSSGSKTPVRKSVKTGASPRGVRRKLSPTSSAEIAAKMLKKSSPKKLDKNKKKALLVLGKASRNQLLSQNIKTLLKRKIVRKAIKQSTAAGGVQDVPKKKAAAKIVQKKISKPTKKLKKVKKPSQPSRASSVKSPAGEKTPTATPRGKKVLETRPENSAQQSSPTLTLTTEESPSKQRKKSEVSGLALLYNSSVSESSSPPTLEQSPKNYKLASNCRSSKRLSSKKETDRPDFIELCPTALGLIPKNMEVFKTPKVNKRRSFNLATPKNVQSSGIIKSASTSKIGNHKSVRFTSKDLSFNSEMHSPNVAENSHFTSFQTPNITVDLFVSPLTDKSSTTKKASNESALKTGEISKTSSTKGRRSNSEPIRCVRKLLQSPVPEKSSDEVGSNRIVLSRSSRMTASQSPSPAKVVRTSKAAAFGNLNDVKGVRELFRTPRTQKSPKNSLSDLKGVSRLLRTPREVKSPKNDLTDVKGVKKLFQTPKVQNSPKNDLTDVRGVKKLLTTPKPQKSPKNDLSDIRGVKKLLRTPKAQKSPKNDLSDIRGVKKLLRTPKAQKSPKNDLSDIRGVKKLLRTPKAQKSPKNDLSDLRGVKKLLQSPRVQKSPKNDLSNVAGVRELLGTPRVRKSPKNDLSDLRGVKNLLGSPKVQKGPKNDLSDLTGVKALFASPRVQKSPRNNLLDVSGVGKLFESPKVRKRSGNSAEGGTEPTKSLKTVNESLTNVTAEKQLLISKSPEKNKKRVSRKSHVNDFRAIRGRRLIHSLPKGPKNDLSDPTGVRELFLRHKPTYNFDISLTGVAELFELPQIEAASTQQLSKPVSETASEAKKKMSKAVRSKKEEVEEGNETEMEPLTRGTRLRKVAKESPRRATRTKKPEEAGPTGKRPAKRKAAEVLETARAKRPAAKEPRKSAKSETRTTSRTRAKSKTAEADTEEVKTSRKRKTPVEDSEPSPPKLRRRAVTVEAQNSAAKIGSSSRATSEATTEKKTTVRSVKKAPAKTKTSKVQSKTAIKPGAKPVRRVQSRSQTSSKTASSSEETASPRITRRGKAKASGESVRTVKSAEVERSRASPVVKRSTRRK